MRQALAFLLSIALSLLVTWAGIHYDSALLYLGLALLLFTIVLWLWTWAKPVVVPVPIAGTEPDWTPQDDKSQALLSLKRARDNARVAVHNRSQEQMYRAMNEFQAALTSVKKQYGVGGILKLSGEVTYRDALQAYVAFADSFYPYLKEGHIEEAKVRAASFSWSRGE
jgi:hypothetical protein